MRTGFLILNSLFRSSTSGHGPLNTHQCSPFSQSVVYWYLKNKSFWASAFGWLFAGLHLRSSQHLLLLPRELLPQPHSQQIGRSCQGLTTGQWYSPAQQVLGIIMFRTHRTLPSLLQHTLACLIIPGKKPTRSLTQQYNAPHIFINVPLHNSSCN